MTWRKVITAELCLASTFLSGCDIGYSRMLFVTKTNAAIEVDTAPPTMQIAIGRLEGEFGPQFEDRKKIPTLASFKFKNEGFFAPFVGSAFATGDAAIAMAALYGDETPTLSNSSKAKWQQRLDMINDGTFNSSLVLTTKPKKKGNKEVGFLEPGQVKPIFFGTDTSLGLKIAWSGLTAQVPDTARFGYVRKELAWVPITGRPGPVKVIKKDGSVVTGELFSADDISLTVIVKSADNTLAKQTISNTEIVKVEQNYSVGAASLLATVDSSVGLTGRPELDFTYVQYFATGDSATLLAMQPNVRKAMIIRLDPNQQMLVEVYSGQYSVSKLSQRIKDWRDETSDQDPNPRRTAIANFLSRENIGVSTAFWLRTSNKPGRAEQYQKFIDENEIE